MKQVVAFLLALCLISVPCPDLLAGRYYDARVARFTTPDPILNEQPPGDVLKKYGLAPFSMSPYNYGANNPLKYVDPDGKNPLLYVAAALVLSALNPEPLNAPGPNSTTYSTRQGAIEAVSFIADATMVAGAAKALGGITAQPAKEAFGTLTKEGSQLVSQTGSETVSKKAGSEVVEQATKAADRFLGEGARMKVNKAGDAVLVSKDGTKRLRFDFNRPSPHKSPHVHVEQVSNGKWTGKRVFPKDLPKE